MANRESHPSQALADRLAEYCAGQDGQTASSTVDELKLDAQLEPLAATVRRLERHWSPPRPGVRDDRLLWGVPEVVGRFVVSHEIGRGGFGVVFKAHDPQLDRPVALKLPRGDAWADDEALTRFQREAKIVATLEHPAIVPVYEAGFIGPLCYIASMYCDGPDLGRWLREHPQRLAPGETAEIVAQLAAAVHYAHQRGVIHRDIKPSNVLLVPQRITAGDGARLAFRPRLTDFGLARMETDEWSTTRTSLVVGTPLYMAPECFQKASAHWTPASDIYSLGAVLYEMLTGRPPLEGAAIGEIIHRIQREEPKPPHTVNKHVPLLLSTVCSKCLAKEPPDRYATAEELADDLARFLRGEAIRARPTTTRDRVARWCRQPARLLVAGKYSIGFNAAMIAWMLVNLVFLAGVVPNLQWWDSVVDILLVTIVFHVPKIWLAWRVLHGSRWAFWPATLAGLVLTGILLLAASGTVVFFDQNYPTAHSRVATFSLIIGATLFESLAFLLAIPAYAAQRAQRSTFATAGN